MSLYIKLSVCVPRLIPGRGFYAQISSEITSEFPGVTKDHIEHLRCNEQWLFLFIPILVYFPYKFDSIISKSCINEVYSMFVSF